MFYMIKKMSLIGFILMIFIFVFGFVNSLLVYYLMGYSVIFFYIFFVLLFFILFVLMMVEMGVVYCKEEGGIYFWMNNSVGLCFVFIGMFMWFFFYIIWMVSIFVKVWVLFLIFFYGSDMIQYWCIVGLEFMQVVGLLVVVWMILVIVVVFKGINKIVCIIVVGGIVVMCLNLVLLLVSIIILLLNGGYFVQDINFFVLLNLGYQFGLVMLLFVVFVIFVYGGIEVVGGLVDKMENLEKNFVKGIVFVVIVILIGYLLVIFLWGVSINWQQVLSNGFVNFGNIIYVLMKSFGMMLGNVLYLLFEVLLLLGVWFVCIIGFLMFFVYIGVFFMFCYLLLKVIIQGMLKVLWLELMMCLNVMGMLFIVMWMQCGLVIIFILLVLFGGGIVLVFFNKLMLMVNVFMMFFYLFFVLVFLFFKVCQDFDRLFVIFKMCMLVMIVMVVVVLVVIFVNVFIII